MRAVPSAALRSKCLAICTVAPYVSLIRVRSVRHRGLKRFLEDDDDREIRRDLVNRVRRVLTALIAASDMGGVQGPPGWRIHQLAGDRAGTWSVSVSGNWRITFTLEGDEICDLHLEDDH